MSTVSEEQELLHLIALLQIPEVGIGKAKTLLLTFGSAQEVFNRSPGMIKSVAGIGDITAKSIFKSRDKVLERAHKELEFIGAHNIQVYSYTSNHYPHRLKEIINAPLILYYKGTPVLESQRLLGVVGTRNASDFGKRWLEQTLEGLAPYNPVIVSGLAYGIDICAHKAAIRLGMPTVGVLAHGLDILYPNAHRSIAQQMLNQGGLLSEYVSGVGPAKTNFPDRNRIVAGLIDGLLVVETDRKGGSMITAEIASSYSREVMAMPGRRPNC